MVGTQGPDPPPVPVSTHKAAPPRSLQRRKRAKGHRAGAGAALSGAGRGGLSIKQPGRNLEETIKHGAETLH